jgi:hypothetical protein
MRPIDLPSTAHFQSLPCGTRAKYVAGGCRCLPCRAANSRYECARQAARRRGDWNGRVSADRARAHLLALSKAGIGRRAVSAASGVSHSSLQAIRTGRKTQIRAQTERRILAVDRSCCSDHALVDARPAWRRLRQLLADGYPARRLCQFLGYVGGGLQFGARWITARNALRIERLYRDLLALEERRA